MAINGYVETNSYNGAYLRLDWTRTSYDSTAGINYVHWVLKGVKSTSGYYYARNFKVTSYNFVTGNTTELYSSSADIQLYNGTVIAEGDEYFYTNSDGTCRIQFNIEGAIYTYTVNCTGYDAWDMDTIPRKSTFTAQDGTIGVTDVQFRIDRKNDSFTDSIYYINPSTNAEVLIVNKTTSKTPTWSPPSSLYQYFPNNKGIYLTFKIYTYNGNTEVGSNFAYASVWANEDDCKPTLSVTVTPTNYSSLTGSATTIIKSVSNVTISATATAKNSATIKNIKTNNQTVANSTSGSITLSKVETGTFETIATDSREFTQSNINGGASPFTVVNYVPLTISAEVARENATSSTVKATVSGKYYNGSFGSVTNTLTLTWKYKLRSASSWSTGGTLTATITNNEYTTGEVTLGSTFSYENDYDFLFTAVDKIYTSGVSTNLPINKGIPIFDYGVDSNGNNYFNVNGYIYGSSATTGQEIPTNEYIDGNRVYRKRINIGALPNTTTKNVSHDLSNVTFIKISGMAYRSSDGTYFPLPFNNPSQLTYGIAITATASYIQIITGMDRSNLTGYVDLYYTKN